jgi:hypothetical protein
MVFQTIKNINMQYNDLVLFAFGFGGVMIHNLTKISELQKKGNFNFHKYYATEWAAITTSLIVVALCIAGKHEVAQLDQAGKWLGLAFTTIGYMGQSLLVKWMGKANKVLGGDDDSKNAQGSDTTGAQ